MLTSGLDDYPRAVPPHLGELHVDLASWMGFFARTMRDVAEFLGEEEDAEEFDEQYDAIVGNIEDLHWNEEEQMYCDASIDEDGTSQYISRVSKAALNLCARRRVVPCLPPRLHLALPFPPLPPSFVFASSRPRPRAHAQPYPPLVAVRHPLAQ